MPNFVSHIATVELPVGDLNQSVEFYTRVLGVKVIFKGDKNAMLSFQSKGVPTLFLVETEGNGGLSFRNSNTEVIHSVIDFYTPKLEEFYTWLKENGVEVGTFNLDKETGLGGFGFKDPDGNLISACNVLHHYQ
ncbi:VOC family protein [Fictibacillus enclensis]|uniref:VOC family protein n=1 Tax=Fictibacillus enclensis TaxID=1017270 RepID=UPI0025A0EC9D|nr:VOC family protein [Fictibacillus enclensis]MDM5197572.1 VOC family protein [Fictibacillus enclensis]